MEGKYTKQDNLAIEIVLFCTPAGARTLDTLIKSQVLYQLSYKRILIDLRVQRWLFILYLPNILPLFFYLY